MGRNGLKISGSGLKRVEIDSSGLKMDWSGWDLMGVSRSGWK